MITEHHYLNFNLILFVYEAERQTEKQTQKQRGQLFFESFPKYHDGCGRARLEPEVGNSKLYLPGMDPPL